MRDVRESREVRDVREPRPVKVKPPRVYKYQYEITPAYWPKQYGEVPVLGIIKADSVFEAKRKAWDRNIAPTPDLDWIKCTMIRDYTKDVKMV